MFGVGGAMMALKISEGHTQHRVVGNSATVLLDPTGGGRLASGAVGQPTEEHRRTQPTSVISVGVIDEKSFTRQCITRCLQTLGDRFDIVPFATCDDFLQSKEVRDIILYHIHGDTSSWNEKNDHFISVKKLLDIVPVIILSDINNPDISIEMFEHGARGVIPTANTTLEQVIEIIGLVKVGGVFVPLSSLSLQKSKQQSVTSRPADQFTPGELAILDRLKLGKANKIIAHELGVSESTVKVHIGRIMKKLKVTNRTQVVCRAFALAAAAAPYTDGGLTDEGFAATHPIAQDLPPRPRENRGRRYC
jgi:DNA-binding NarL/FixJ family response regulator